MQQTERSNHDIYGFTHGDALLPEHPIITGALDCNALTEHLAKLERFKQDEDPPEIRVAPK